jgi:hypothetical protein
MQKVLNEDYFAGHWRCHLVYQLSWTVLGGEDAPDVQRPSKPPMKYRAPSWSWASADGGIGSTDLTPFDPAKVELNNILDTHVMPLRENPFGHVKTRSLRVRGLLSKAYMDSSPYALV